jgi:hypothetical protein
MVAGGFLSAKRRHASADYHPHDAEALEMMEVI